MQENRKKILLVDDSSVNLKIARNILMGLYDVFTVPSAEKMYRFLENVLPDMILLDVLMPDIDGYEAIRHIKADPRTRDIPVIFLTSKSGDGSELEGLSLGAVDYVLKPFTPQLLLKRVEIHMCLESQREELKFINANLERLVEAKTSSIMALQNTILTTVSHLVENRDDVTGKHVERVAQFLRLFVEEMLGRDVYTEAQDWDLELLLQSSQLHDVGKISIHDHILLKPDKLTPEEFEIMKQHAKFGEAIIDKIQQNASESAFLTHAKIMAGTHHEKWNGSGYPRGLAGQDIPLQGRLMAFVDVYDALTSERPYKKAFPHEQAVDIIVQDCGTHFDPNLAEIFQTAAWRFRQPA
jgi:putative two-component system response regulator